VTSGRWWGGMGELPWGALAIGVRAEGDEVGQGCAGVGERTGQEEWEQASTGRAEGRLMLTGGGRRPRHARG
jgi:hypothetical protein